jgi:hypothetical protein
VEVPLHKQKGINRKRKPADTGKKLLPNKRHAPQMVAQHKNHGHNMQGKGCVFDGNSMLPQSGTSFGYVYLAELYSQKPKKSIISGWKHLFVRENIIRKKS